MAAWDLAAILDGAVMGIKSAAAALDEEQAVRGIDALDELSLHLVIADGLRAVGRGVFHEERYPSERLRRRRSEGRRCDLVVTSAGRELHEDRAQLNLFTPRNPCPLEEALWVEVKTVAQFAEGNANSRYEHALQAPLFADVRKLAADAGIVHAALMVVLFAANDSVAEHDLAAWVDIARRRRLPISEPLVRQIRFVDRVGNGVCATAVVPVITRQ